MVCCRNLQHMAPFGIPTAGFCMFFRYATLVFPTPGTISGTPDPKFGPWLGCGPFRPKTGPGKHDVVEEMVPVRIYGDLCEGIGLYGAQEAFGQGHFPLNPTRKSLYRDSPISRKNPWALPGPLAGSLLTL